MASRHPDLIDISEVLGSFLAFDPVCSAGPELGEGVGGDVVVDELRCECPFELAEGATDTGSLWLAGAPPTQSLETSVMPVWHRLRFRVVRETDDGR